MAFGQHKMFDHHQRPEHSHQDQALAARDLAGSIAEVNASLSSGLDAARGDAVVLLSTFLLTVFRDLMEGIMVGTALGVILLIQRLTATAGIVAQPARAPFAADLVTDPRVIVYRLSGTGTAGFPPNAVTYRVLYGSATDTSVRYEPTTEQRPHCLGRRGGQSAGTSNPVVVSYGAEGRAWDRNVLTLAHNTLLNDGWLPAWFLRVFRDRLPEVAAGRADRDERREVGDRGTACGGGGGAARVGGRASGAARSTRGPTS